LPDLFSDLLLNDFMKISFVVLSRNEQKNIARCLSSIKNLADEILVIDELSTDKTCEIAEGFGARIIKHKNSPDFAGARNMGMEKTRNAWVFFVDSDEVLMGEMEKLREIGGKESFRICRTDVMWGKEIKHGENGAWNEIRFVKKSSGKWVGKVHEVFETSHEIGQLENVKFMHYPHQTIGEFLSEINKYSEIRAQELLAQGVKSSVWQIILFPFGKFMLDYVLLLGFLDGTPGFVIAVMMSFYSFLVRSKLYILCRDRRN
jgi:glycosyltransferase involved in cell wall biosynthesis